MKEGHPTTLNSRLIILLHKHEIDFYCVWIIRNFEDYLALHLAYPKQYSYTFQFKNPERNVFWKSWGPYQILLQNGLLHIFSFHHSSPTP